MSLCQPQVPEAWTAATVLLRLRSWQTNSYPCRTEVVIRLSNKAGKRPLLSRNGLFRFRKASLSRADGRKIYASAHIAKIGHIFHWPIKKIPKIIYPQHEIKRESLIRKRLVTLSNGDTIKKSRQRRSAAASKATRSRPSCIPPRREAKPGSPRGEGDGISQMPHKNPR